MPANLEHPEFRVTTDGLWLGNTLLMQTPAPEQLRLLLHEFPRIQDVGGHSNSPHKVLIYDTRGIYAIHDTERDRILNLTIVWSPEAEDYSPRHPFSGTCWLNGRLLQKHMALDALPLSGEIVFKPFFGGMYSAFFRHFYVQVKCAAVRTAKGYKSRRRVLTSLHFSFSTEGIPREFVAQRLAEQP